MAKKELEEKAQRARGYLTVTNIPITKENNVIYGCEVEYILYGSKGSGGWAWLSGKEPECNIANAKRDIFALRFMCNSIFALTDSEIDKVTLPPHFLFRQHRVEQYPTSWYRQRLNLHLL